VLLRTVLLIVLFVFVTVSHIDAQGGARGGGAPAGGRGGGRGATAPANPKADAAIDLTGTWTAVISEDWPLRMLTPKKGDYTRVPLTPAARKIADAWDPAKDEAAGEQCRAYGAGGVMRLPGRLRISWQDDTTLKMELEAGTQTRLFRFQPLAPSEREPVEGAWQGQSVAQWQYTRVPPRTGEMKVVTTKLRPGYLRKNGVPYSANATLTEYYHRTTAPNGDIWITVVSELTDPENLREPFVQSTHFKRLPANAAFKPEPCEPR
jgi:hypothetical protein